MTRDAAQAMCPVRLECSVFAPSDQELPRDEDHPYRREIDALAAALAQPAPGALPAALVRRDAPPKWVFSFWIGLPTDPIQRERVVSLILSHLIRARAALPAATWEVTIDDRPLEWDGQRFAWP